jgi:hypothetical protein
VFGLLPSVLLLTWLRIFETMSTSKSSINRSERQVSNVYELLNENALASKKHVIVEGVKCA